MNGHFRTLVVVSPASEGGEEKNQDRAGWHAPTATAAICDGVSASPYADRAAELVVSFSPVLFMGDPASRSSVAARIQSICDLLISRRMAECQSAAATDPGNLSMARMLHQVRLEKLKESYQTTLAAFQLVRDGDQIRASLCRCGDSSFIVMDAAGVPLVASPSLGNEVPEVDPSTHRNLNGLFRFGPGDELMVKVCPSDRCDPAMLGSPRIRCQSATKWIACKPVDQISKCDDSDNNSNGEDRTLGPDDHLLVPTYLVGGRSRNGQPQYLRLHYSQSVRLVRTATTPDSHPSHSVRTNVTNVLPDHGVESHLVHLYELFPGDTHFIIATDGFTDCMGSAEEMFEWLTQNEAALHNPRQREVVMRDLHVRLQNARGDDDISFVWVQSEPLQ